MKKMVMMFAVVLFSATFVLAQETNKKEIQTEQLPVDVRNAIGSSEYNTWALVKIYEVSPEAAGEEQTFEVIVAGTDGVEKTLHYDPKGNLLEGEN